MRWSAGCAVAFAASVAVATGSGFLAAKPGQTPSQESTLGHSSSSLKVGDKVPGFRATDQFGEERDFENLKGRDGLVILFFRSADW